MPSVVHQQILRSLRWLGAFGVNPVVGLRALRSIPGFVTDRQALRRQSRTSARPMRFGPSYPCLADRYAQSGTASGHYFHQDLLVAQRVFDLQPTVHIDVGSRVDGFVAHVAAYRPIRVLDIRELTISIRNIEFVQCDLMRALPAQLVHSADSVSCLHTIEHLGLGRYGDRVCFDGYLLGLSHLFQLVIPRGTLFLSTPIGPERIEFNAHRVFAADTITSLLREHSRIRRFSYVDDTGALHDDVSVNGPDARDSVGCQYGCGIWECEVGG